MPDVLQSGLPFGNTGIGNVRPVGITNAGMDMISEAHSQFHGDCSICSDIHQLLVLVKRKNLLAGLGIDFYDRL
jgi:hypothetical protein